MIVVKTNIPNKELSGLKWWLQSSHRTKISRPEKCDSQSSSAPNLFGQAETVSGVRYAPDVIFPAAMNSGAA